MPGLKSSSSNLARANSSTRSPGGPKLKAKSKSNSSSSRPKSKSKSSRSTTDTISPSEPTAKRQRQRLAADSLRWKALNTGSFAGVDAGGGMMMLEELEGVGVEWEEDDKGRKVARFVVSERPRHVAVDILGGQGWTPKLRGTCVRARSGKSQIWRATCRLALTAPGR